jgi:hypothetical protein
VGERYVGPVTTLREVTPQWPERVSHPCLLCKQAGRRPSREHLFAAGLGRHADVTLPLGAVCVACNNKTGREVDEALVHLPDILFMRGLLGVPAGRSGRIRELAHRDGTIEFTEEGPRINFLVVAAKDDPSEKELAQASGAVIQELDGGEIKFTLAFDRRHYAEQVRRAARSILKSAIYIDYADRGAHSALHASWDSVRDAVLQGPRDGYALVSAPTLPERWPDLRLSITSDVPGTRQAVRFSYGTVEIITDLEMKPISSETAGWAREHQYRTFHLNPAAAS